MAKTILKKSGGKVAVKLHGTDLNETITLNSDCLVASEALSGTQRANIISMHWSGAANAFATITRNSVKIAILQANSTGELTFYDTDFTDSIENESDIVVTSSGEMQVWIVLRKVSGYSSKIETAEFSVYDDTNAVGS
jgi:hypothetical protein